ncbi:MAG: hypothetical protein C0467_30190, partial [Planctomycetaceae bacterium]|nr:hypothetical protein [Planctomycetaceae bacterium]
ENFLGFAMGYLLHLRLSQLYPAPSFWGAVHVGLLTSAQQLARKRSREHTFLATVSLFLKKATICDG